MEPADLFENWASFADRIRKAPHLCIVCDFDGTLVPATAGSARPVLPPETGEQLRRLSSLRRVTLGIVSGRPLAELRALVPVEPCWYAGLHGFEIRTPQGLERRWYTRKELRRLTALGEFLERRVAPIPGARVDRKGGGVAVFYDAVERGRIREVQDAVLEGWKEMGEGLRLRSAFGVLELLPAENRTKGTALRFILVKIRRGVLPIYMGDDRTDLEAFRALRGSGIRIGVGDEVSRHLDYRIPDPPAAGRALRRIADLLVPGRRP